MPSRGHLQYSSRRTAQCEFLLINPAAQRYTFILCPCLINGVWVWRPGRGPVRLRLLGERLSSPPLSSSGVRPGGTVWVSTFYHSDCIRCCFLLELIYDDRMCFAKAMNACVSSAWRRTTWTLGGLTLPQGVSVFSAAHMVPLG